MTKNLGTIDRIIRVFLALIAAVLLFAGVFTGTTAVVLGIIGLALVLTSFVSFCPLYRLLGIATIKKQSS